MMFSGPTHPSRKRLEIVQSSGILALAILYVIFSLYKQYFLGYNIYIDLIAQTKGLLSTCQSGSNPRNHPQLVLVYYSFNPANQLIQILSPTHLLQTQPLVTSTDTCSSHYQPQ